MNILVIGAGGVGASMASIAETRSFFTQFVLADISLSRAEEAIALLDDRSKFVAEQVDARDMGAIKALIQKVKADVVVNACDPRMNEPIFNAAFEAHCNYIDMAMNLSEPHASNPYEEVGSPLGADQLAADQAWRDRGLLALVGMGVEPGLSDVFARYAADNLFDTIDEIGVRDGSNLSIDGLDFAPTFSIWTTIEECLNPPIVWEKNRGLYTTDCFSEPEVFHFPAGIGPYECVNVEHEEVLLIPREIDCNRVTFKYSLGAEFIDWLKTDPADIICLQETKATKEDVDLTEINALGYHDYWFSATSKKGYSGVAVFTKIIPDKVELGNGHTQSDDEGRVIQLHFGKLLLINAYFPSGTSGEDRQAFKYVWLDAFFNYLTKDQKKHAKIIL